MDIYVGNLAYATDDEGLRAAFAAYGEVTSAHVVTDRMTNRSKGFGFVEMPNDDEANAAIAALNGAELDGRPLRVNESQPKPREDRPRRPYAGGYGDRPRRPYGDRPRRPYGDRPRGGYGDRPRGPRGGYGDRGPRRGGYGRRDYDAPPESQW